jgi:hypothetical protein
MKLYQLQKYKFFERNFLYQPKYCKMYEKLRDFHKFGNIVSKTTK